MYHIFSVNSTIIIYMLRYTLTLVKYWEKNNYCYYFFAFWWEYQHLVGNVSIEYANKKALIANFLGL